LAPGPAASSSGNAVVTEPTIEANGERPEDLRGLMEMIKGLEIDMGRCIDLHPETQIM